MKLYEILEKSALSASSLQQDDGSMPPGHNGPYNDPETPVRNTAHWLITFLKAYEITGDKLFIEAAQKAVNYLTSQDARPMDATFWIRKNPEKDFCNGLVGQAWVIEALVAAAQAFSREDLFHLALETFMLHPYDQKVGGWRTVNVDGSFGRLDYTFNHQLWFAASGALIHQTSSTSVDKNIHNFLDRLNQHLAIYPNGLIRHKSNTFLAKTYIEKVWNLLNASLKKPGPTYMRMKSIGYHGFNLYGFGLLHQVFPDHPFWSCGKFQKTLDYAGSEEFKNSILESKYGYPYNPPGFEIPFALQSFGQPEMETMQKWVESQIKFSFDKDRMLLCRNTQDPKTMAARLYEATRLGDITLNIDF
jgi:hypothetical protein